MSQRVHNNNNNNNNNKNNNDDYKLNILNKKAYHNVHAMSVSVAGTP
jgi:hypothetical protein